MAPSVSVNENVSPPTITVGINGKTAQANLPAGGGSNEWETFDLSANYSTLKEDDRLLIITNAFNTADGVFTFDNATENNRKFVCEMIVGSTLSASPLYMNTQGYNIALSTLTLLDLNTMNLPSHNLLQFNLSYCGITSTTPSITHDTITVNTSTYSQYIYKCFIKRSN